MKQAIGLGLLVLLAGAGPAWSETAQVGVLVDLPPTSTITTSLDANSACLSPDEVVFDLIDAEDVGVLSPSAYFAYQPHRSAVGKNCHLLNINSNGSSMTLSASVTGAVAPTLSVFFGGFFAAISGDNFKGGKSTDWELLNGFTRTLNEPFAGIAPVNYRIGNGFVPPSTSGSGLITYTLVSN